MDSNLFQMSEQNKSIVEIIIKYSVAILAYNLLLNYSNSSTLSFDSLDMTVFLTFIFSVGIYYKFISPNVASFSEHPILKSIQKDILFFGTILLAVNVVMSMSGQTGLISKSWITNLIYVLVGILVYRIIIEPFFPTSNFLSGDKLEFSNDVLQLGTILAVVNTLYGKSLLSRNFMQPFGFLVIGFSIYYLLKNAYNKLNLLKN